MAPQADGVPHNHDIEVDSTIPAKYECLQCGRIVEAESHPGDCECGGEFQGRAKSLE